jgi:hypothetical protein
MSDTTWQAHARPEGVLAVTTKVEKHELLLDYEEVADLWQQLRAAWLTQTGKEELQLTAQSVEEGDFFEGWEIKATFIDMEHTTLHFDNFGKLTVPNRTMLTIMRTIQ